MGVLVEETRSDALVIGAGLGGLSCAAYLAVNGVRPLVLEQNQVAGGCSQVFRRTTRAGKWEFDVCRLSPRARAVIVGESGDYACPPSRTAAAFHAGFLDHYLQAGAYYPAGGGQVLAAHLIDVIQAHGGAVHTRTRVDRILVR